MDTAMARRLLAVLLLCSLAFEVAFARDGSFHHRRGRGRRHRGKAKGYYAHKPQPTPYFAPDDSHVPPPYPQMPAPVSSPPLPYEELAPADEPYAPPPSYELPAPLDEPPSPAPYYAPAYYAPAPAPTKAAHVQGVVLCQNCMYVGTSYYSYGKPLPGAVVKLTCESRDNSSFEAKAQTDDSGHFLIQVTNFDFEKYSVVEDCKVYLVSSSTSTCSTPTDINSGISGSPIRMQMTSSDKILYSSRPLVFAPKYCRPTPPPFMSESPPQRW